MMRTHIELTGPLLTEDVTFDKRIQLSDIPLKYADAIQTTFANASVLAQYISHYIVSIESYEWNIKRGSTFTFLITEDSFFLLALSGGNSILYNNMDDVVFEMSDRACLLFYLKAGTYKCQMMQGKNHFLLLNIHPQWLIEKYGALKELQELIAVYKNNELPSFRLPIVAIGEQLINALHKLNSKTSNKDIDFKAFLFLENSINVYLLQLREKIARLEKKAQKVKDIAHFIESNFRTEIVNSDAALADHFGINKASLIRLVKLHYGIPLHKKVMELRMQSALAQLSNTQVSIKEIAFSLGYNDVEYFSRAFKKRFGMSPNHHRKIKI